MAPNQHRCSCCGCSGLRSPGNVEPRFFVVGYGYMCGREMPSIHLTTVMVTVTCATHCFLISPFIVVAAVTVGASAPKHCHCALLEHS